MEFALTVTILASLIFGIFETALAFYSYNVIAEMSREATRYASVRGSNCTGLKGPDGKSNCAITQAQLNTFVQKSGFPAIDSTNLTTTATWSKAPGAASCSNASCNGPGDQVNVKVSYSFPLSIPFVSGQTLSMTNTSKMIISN